MSLFNIQRCGPAAGYRCSPVIARHNDFAPLFSLLEDFGGAVSRQQPSPRRRHFAPRFDLKEVKDTYVLEGELPGFDQKDISIEFTDDQTLVIAGRSEAHRERGTKPRAVTADQEQPATDANAEKAVSHQPTVEDSNEDGTEPASDPKPEQATPEQTQAPAEPKNTYWVSERTSGRFKRSFAFPERINQDAVKASLKNGVLEVNIPKAAKPESRKIQVE